MDKKGSVQASTPQTPQPQQAAGPIRPFKQPSEAFFTTSVLIFMGIAIVLGVVTGFLLTHGKKADIAGGKVETSQVKKGLTVGSDDTKTFKDKAEGVLKKGGIENEGQFHLERPGGASQNVYMTSSIVDLSSFVDKKVLVWGQTFDAKKAGWLMDVGRLEVLE